MSREQSLRNGAGLMVLGALIFLVYAVVFFFRAFASGGFEVGVETLNGVTPQQLDGLNPAIMGYITHLQWFVVGVDNGRDRARRGIGRSVATALHGAFQLRLGEPPRADLHWDDHLRRRGGGRADRAEPSGARRSTSRALEAATGNRTPIWAAQNPPAED